MRYQGKITEWNENRGFGFVIPNGGGPRVFLHIKAFAARRRPAVGDLVTYELGADDRGRPRALKVRPATISHKTHPALLPGPGSWSLLFAMLFLLFVLASVLTGRLPVWVLLVYGLSSLAAFVAYRLDKSAANAGAWRTKEGTLHLLSMVGGWPGAMLAQRKLRHKTRKAAFQRAFWTTVVINVLLIIGLLSPVNSGVFSF